jgi:hypothetical protein
MDVRTAVHMAKNYVKDILEEEKPVNIGLEEVEFDPGTDEWRVTIGFSRAWDSPTVRMSILEDTPSRRSFKVVRIANSTSEVLSMRNRELAQ